MTNAGLLRRIRPFALLVMLSVAASADGCDGGSETSGTGLASASSSASGGGEGGAGGIVSTGGGGAGGTPIFNGVVQEIASSAVFQNPYDATPDPKGEEIYFTAVDAALSPGVFHVKADGSAAAEPVLVGAPFVAPTGISMSTDGKTLVIADPGWDTQGATPGAIVSMPVGGGAPKVIAGTEGLVPQTLDVIRVIPQETARDVIYFTGIGLGGPGVFRVDLDGGPVDTILTGSAEIPLDTVSGVSASNQGEHVYAVNVDPQGKAGVIDINFDKAFVFLSDLSVGNPGGVALALDESELLISMRDAVSKASTIMRYDTGTKEIDAITDVISKYDEPAGLHRAHKANVFAFVDNQAHGTGAIFVLR